MNSLVHVCCWLYFKIGRHICSISLFLDCDRKIVSQYLKAPVEKKDDHFAAAIENGFDPLSFDNTFDEVLDDEQDILERDVFEKQIEYEKRIKCMDPVHLGFGLLRAKQTDSYTKFSFPQFTLSKSKKIIGAKINAFVPKIDPKEYADNEILDGEIVAGLLVHDKQVCYDYSRVVLKTEHKSIPLLALYWKPFVYEDERGFQNRLLEIPVLPVGVSKPIKKEYDLESEMLPFQMSGYNFIKQIYHITKFKANIKRHEAKKICLKNEFWNVYGKIKFAGNKVNRLLFNISNGKDSYPIDLDSYSIDLSVEILISLAEYYVKEGKNQNYEKAFQAYKKAAEKDDKYAQKALGDCYFRGIGVDLDHMAALTCYLKAASQGNPEAQYAAGDCYANGYGTLKDYGKALEFYHRAADHGNINAQYKIGCFY